MDLQWLQDRGGLIPQSAIETREVSWTHPGPDGQDVTDTFTVRVKKLTVGEVERLIAESGRKPGLSYSATMISETVLLGDEGDARLTYEQAFQLDPMFADRLLAEAVQKVNPLHRRPSAKN